MRSIHRFICAAAVLPLGFACSSPNVTAPDPLNPAAAVDAGTPTTAIWGVAWDPEAFLINYASCQPDCSPDFSPTSALYQGSLVQGEVVDAFDPNTGPVGESDPTGKDGQFSISGVPSSDNGTVYLVGGGGQLAPYTGKQALPTIPPGNYFTTIGFRPIATHFPTCTDQAAPVISDSGILEAVAKYLTYKNPTTPTSAGDFTDPEKYQGVAVIAMNAPTWGETTLLPASGTTLSASAGHVYNIDWKDPNGPLTAQEQATISSRGFVVTEDATSPLGLVVLTQSNDDAPGPIVVDFVDPTTAPDQGRPWQYAETEVPLPTGLVGYANVGMSPAPDPNAPPDQGGGFPLPDYLCIPSGGP